ncbi:S-layer homology domain-containing protein [Brevibacillus sp. NRS-1366]|uniref:S-layer homology domain-containing protein n=1 Tax=Brevibacillus sp. NRS-1366 TaxID=3233899 RepID=UPI003D20CA69
MRKQNQSWGLAMGVSSSILMTTLLTTLGMSGGAHAVYAAEQQTKMMSQEEAIQAAKKWVTIPSDYKLERANFLDAKRDPFSGQSSWRISWEKNDSEGIYATIDAVSGNLLQYSRYRVKDKLGNSQKKLTEEQALKTANQFLMKVTTSEERQKLSQPNEYGSPSSYYNLLQMHLIHFTRMENDIPFLENGFQLVVDQDGEVASFSRDWYEERLPDAKQAISLEEGQKLLTERVHPSLVYMDWNERFGGLEPGQGKYRLVYTYDESDPQFVDAISGKVINALGQEAVERKIKPLGTTISPSSGEDRLITKEEAQKIAEQIIQKLPGSYRSDGSSGGGSSRGSDGIEHQNWKFDFTPLHAKNSSEEQVQLRIGDRGALLEYETREGILFGDRGRKIEKGISWEQAEASAVSLVKTLFHDRLGEIYLLEQKPSEADLKQMLERGQSYRVLFGWLKDGVVIQDFTCEVMVNPETGEAEGFSARRDELPLIHVEKGAQKIDQTKAQKAMQEQKEWKLTYFQPQNRRYAQTFERGEPLLVYRYVGDDGVVDASSGEWLSFAEAEKNKDPQDIEEHPQKAALEFAVRMDLLQVADGKLEPDKQVTRGEMLQILSRLTNRYEFRYLRSSFSDDEKKPYQFADVDTKNRYYAAIQKGIQYNLIAREGKNFEPDRDITRIEAADMLARLLGYAALLDKPEIFASPYQDLQKKQIPAAALVNAQGILPGKSEATFSPNAPLTRAEIAELLQVIFEQNKNK